MDTIFKRRSIREYTSQSVKRVKLVEFIKAGMNAPSARNRKPWHFIIIDDRKILDKITEVHPYTQALKQAPAAIVVCGDLDLDEHSGFWVQDCSTAAQNILLEIADQGFGGVWQGVYPREDRVKGIQSLLNLPENIIPLTIIAVGYPAEEKEPNNFFDEKRIKYNKWE